MNYAILKLITGEEIIGGLESDFMDVAEPLNVDNPYSITYIKLDSGYGIKMLPYMPCSEESLFTIDRKHVILKTIPTKSTIFSYEQSKIYFSGQENYEEDMLDEISTSIILH